MLGVFVTALVIGAALTLLVVWLRNRNITVSWYEWLIGAIGLALVGLGVWHYFGSVAEMYPTAGWIGLAIFDGIGLVLLAVAWQLVARRQRAAG